MRYGAWALDPSVVYLNHGSFGARPVDVVEHQRRIRSAFEENPVRFVEERLAPALNAARAALADFIGLDAEGLVFVSNATSGVNTALRSLALGPGDEILLTDHEYNACRNAVEAVALASGADPVVVPVPIRITDTAQVTERVVGAVTHRTRALLIDHVTSQTALVQPLDQIVPAMPEQVTVIVDGAHSPGMVPVAVPGAHFLTGNCHKWLCSPPGSAFLWVHPSGRDRTDPLVISHGWNTPAPDSRLHALFDWTGTRDFSALLSIPQAIESVGSMLEGGWSAIRRRNRDLTLAGRRILSERLGVAPSAPDEAVGSMAMVQLPDSDQPATGQSIDPLTSRLRHEHGIEVPVQAFPAHPNRLLRFSIHLHNDLDDVARLADALVRVL